MPEIHAETGVMTEETVRGLAESMQIALTDDEVSTLATELTELVNYVSRVTELASDDVPPMSHPLPVVNVMRADEVQEVLTLDEALHNAPEVTDGMFRVTSIMGSEQ